MVFNEVDQLLLGVRFSWDEDWIVHEGFVKVHLVELQLQSFGNLLHKINILWVRMV